MAKKVHTHTHSLTDREFGTQKKIDPANPERTCIPGEKGAENTCFLSLQNKTPETAQTNTPLETNLDLAAIEEEPTKKRLLVKAEVFYTPK